MAEPTTVHDVRALMLERGLSQADFSDAAIAALVAEPMANGKPRSAATVIQDLQADRAFNESAAPEAIAILHSEAARLGGIAPKYVAQTEANIHGTTAPDVVAYVHYRPDPDGRMTKPVHGSPAQAASWALQDARRAQELDRRRAAAIEGAKAIKADPRTPQIFKGTF